MEEFSIKPQNSHMKTIKKLHPMDPTLVARRVEALRVEANMTKRDFAAILTMDPSTYTKVSTGKMPLAAEHAYTLAEKFSVPMDFIYRGDLSRIPDTRSKPLTQILNSQ